MGNSCGCFGGGDGSDGRGGRRAESNVVREVPRSLPLFRLDQSPSEDYEYCYYTSSRFEPQHDRGLSARVFIRGTGSLDEQEDGGGGGGVDGGGGSNNNKNIQSM